MKPFTIMLRVFSLLFFVVFCCGFENPWSLVGPESNKSASLEFLVHLKRVDALTDPTNELYGKWMSKEEILKMISPPKKEKQAFLAKLKRSGILVKEDRGDNLVVQASGTVIEKIFFCKLFRFRHTVSGRTTVRAKGITIPNDWENVVEIVSGLAYADLPTIVRKRSEKVRPVKAAEALFGYGSTIPAFLRLIYSIPKTESAKGTNSSIVLVEFEDNEAFSAKALQDFLVGVGEESWNMSKIVGPYGGSNGESNLDVQYGGTIAKGLFCSSSHRNCFIFS